MKAQNIDCLVIPDTVDFGACAMALGIGITSSGCTFISGCGTTADNGVDYAVYLFTDMPSCMACQDFNDCLTLPSTSDFGMCDMFLGYAMTENGCQSFSGCSNVDLNGIDYSTYFFDAEYACNNQCIDDVVIDICIDESLIKSASILARSSKDVDEFKKKWYEKYKSKQDAKTEEKLKSIFNSVWTISV